MSQGDVVNFRNKLMLGVAAIALSVTSACGSDGYTVKQGDEEIDIDQALYNEALSLQNDGNYLKATTRWSELLAESPNFAQAHFNQGVIYERLNLVPEAINKYEVAVSLDANFLYHRHLGEAYLRGGLYDAAIIELEKAVELDRFSPIAHYNLSAAYLSIDSYDQALLHADAAVDLYAKPDTKNEDGLARTVDRRVLAGYLAREAECHIARKEWEKAEACKDRIENQCRQELTTSLIEAFEDRAVEVAEAADASEDDS
ncbi:tetratricopeptide repeat protein [Planctomycetota bacterium]|nr:tetratricopeptide repeat protein [Planctomycetota bacterium]